MDVARESGLELPPRGPRLPLPELGPVPDLPDGSSKMILEMGPSHPAMHGTVKMRVRLDGETIERADVDVGYLHRGFEKSCEDVTWTMIFPYTDRLNYVSPLINNNIYAMAVEKLFDLEIPERAKYLRTIAAELSRISDHLTCIGASTMELGAFTGMLYLLESRDIVWDAVEELCGARLTVAYARIGGVVADLPEGFEKDLLDRFKRIDELLVDVDQLLTKNRIFIDRMKGIGAIDAHEAIDWAGQAPVCGQPELLTMSVVRLPMMSTIGWILMCRLVKTEITTTDTSFEWSRFESRFASFGNA